MFLIEHPTDYLDRIEADRKRTETRNRLVRALRGSIPPFNEATEEQLRHVMREQLEHQAEAGR